MMIEKILSWIGVIAFLIAGIIYGLKSKNYDLSILSILYGVCNWVVFLK